MPKQLERTLQDKLELLLDKNLILSSYVSDPL